MEIFLQRVPTKIEASDSFPLVGGGGGGGGVKSLLEAAIKDTLICETRLGVLGSLQSMAELNEISQVQRHG